MKYDVVYYWLGGTEQGRWRAITTALEPESRTPNKLVENLTKMGYVAHRGLRAIGPPEGPPSEAELREALGLPQLETNSG